MKRIAYSFLLVALLCPVCGFGQGKYMFGITGGANSSFFREVPSSSGFSTYNTSSNTGVLAGFEFGYYNWNAICLSAQLLYGERSRNENFVEIPVILKVPITSGSWHLYLYAGPAFDFSGRNGLAITGGAGLSIAINSHADVFLQVGYLYGLSDISSISETLDFSGVSYSEYARDFRLQLGILFGK